MQDLSQQSVSGNIAFNDSTQRKERDVPGAGKQGGGINKQKSSARRPKVDSKENTTEADLVLNEDLNSNNDI